MSGSPDAWPAYDSATLEAECRARWEADDIYRFDPKHPGEPFSVDTPPPYVSASHLHVGHAMSYSQAEFVVRYQRMCGRKVFYPMGFDDNGLPTERHVETVLGIDKRTTTRRAFREACLEETRKGAVTYEALFRALGLSVDWSLRYSTIDPHCRRTAQWSFLDLHRKGQIYRASEPVTWDPVYETALAQADLELKPRQTELHTLRFASPDGTQLPIATTRPELLPACVALYHHPEDERWRGIRTAIVPLFGHEVPLLADADVDRAYGTGLLMVCTFGDADDVRRWRRDALPLRECMGKDGRLTELAGPYRGLKPHSARARIVADLIAAGQYDGAVTTDQNVPVAERSGAPVEWLAVPQWFVRALDHRERMRQKAQQLVFYPAFMGQRLLDWIDGLDRDWNISRQRHYGVPMPVWFCTSCGEAVLAKEEDLPVDPLEDPPPCEHCPSCGGTLQGDPDVMDTWMTSSLTPLITSNRVGTQGRSSGPFPGTVRVQAFEIIRTWLFYTVLKSELHTGSLPFRDVMISGWGLDEQGKKISKRTLKPQHEPGYLMERYGADAVRHWAGRSMLGRDLRFSEIDVRAGRKVAVKLWNAARLVGSFPAPEAARAVLQPEDDALQNALSELLETVAHGLDQYDYATGLHALDRFLFGSFCDDWLEASKERIRRPERFPEGSAEAASLVAHAVLRALLGAYAPYLPFVTDALWWRMYAAQEGGPSLHLTRFPSPSQPRPQTPGLEHVDTVRTLVRRRRTEQELAQSREVALLTVTAPTEVLAQLQALLPTLRAACRAVEVELEVGEGMEMEVEVETVWAT